MVDILLALVLFYAAYRGFREGMVLQLGGLVGLVVGAYAAFHYGERIGYWFSLEGWMAQVVGFLALFIGVLVALALLGRLLKGLFQMAGLGIFDHVGGVVFGFFKMALVLGLLLTALEPLNERKQWIEPHAITSAWLYGPLKRVSEVGCPYINFVQKEWFEFQSNGSI